MKLNEIFTNKIFPELKEYVETNSIYSPTVTKKKPEQSKVFPIVPVRLYQTKNTYTTLTYGEEIYPFRIEIGVYSIDREINGEKVSKRTICDEITSLIEKYFKTNYKVTVSITLDVPNVDSNIHRNEIRILARLDTKYGDDDLVIYPR